MIDDIDIIYVLHWINFTTKKILIAGKSFQKKNGHSRTKVYRWSDFTLESTGGAQAHQA